MIEIKIGRGPVNCPKCERALLPSHERIDCERCQRGFHEDCWDEAQGCVDCPAQPEPVGEPVAEPVAEPVGEPVSEPKAHAGPPANPTWLERPGNLKKLTYVVYAAAGLLLVFELLALANVVYQKHPHEGFDWEGWPGFYPVYGFAAYALIVVLGMGLQKVIMRKEDYYDE